MLRASARIRTASSSLSSRSGSNSLTAGLTGSGAISLCRSRPGSRRSPALAGSSSVVLLAGAVRAERCDLALRDHRRRCGRQIGWGRAWTSRLAFAWPLLRRISAVGGFVPRAANLRSIAPSWPDRRNAGDHDDLIVWRKLHDLPGCHERPRCLLARHHQMPEPR